MKALVGTVSGVPALVAVGIAGRLQHHVELPAGRWAALLVLMWVGTVPFALLGLAIGYGLPPQLAQPVNFLAFLGLSVLGGLLVPAAYFPDVLRHLAHALPTYRFAELGWRAAAGLAPTRPDWRCSSGGRWPSACSLRRRTAGRPRLAEIPLP